MKKNTLESADVEVLDSIRGSLDSCAADCEALSCQLNELLGLDFEEPNDVEKADRLVPGYIGRVERVRTSLIEISANLNAFMLPFLSDVEEEGE